MDIWTKLFPNRMKTDCKKNDRVPPNLTDGSDRPFPFHLKHGGVRVLLYRDCNRRGRKLLYDSQTVQRAAIPETPPHTHCSSRLFRSPLSAAHSATVPHSGSKSLPQSKSSLKELASPSGEKGGRARPVGPITPRQQSWPSRRKSSSSDAYVELRDGFGYQYLKAASDTKQFGEFVFGSVALAYKGPSAKIHLLKNPSRILISRTCRAPRSYYSSRASCDTGLEDSLSSLSTSLNEVPLIKMESLESSSNSSSKPLLKPSVPWEMHSTGMKVCASEEDSGFSGPPSPFSSTCGSYLNPASLSGTPMGTPSSRSGSGNSLKCSGSLSSLQRRFLRNVATSLESFGFASLDGDRRDTLSSYQTKLGLAVIIEMKQDKPEVERQAEEWWFCQQDILDTLINKLQVALENAYLHSSKFVSCVYAAVAQFRQELMDLVFAPRLAEPLWLSLLGAKSESMKEKLHSKLIDSLAYLLNQYDTKQTNFFVSKLLTGVLTYHLGWVSTVGSQISTLPRKSSFSQRKPSANLTDVLESYLTKTQPYNALWGQLCELTGLIGHPPRVSKTIVVGTDKTLLSHILILLSYLIRCSQVVKNDFEVALPTNEGSVSSKSNKSSRSSLGSIATLVESIPHKSTIQSEASIRYPTRPFRSSTSKSSDERRLTLGDSLKRCSLRREDLNGKKDANMHSKESESIKTQKTAMKNQETCLIGPTSPTESDATNSPPSPLFRQCIGLATSKTMSNLSAAFDTSHENLSSKLVSTSLVKSLSSNISPSISLCPSVRNLNDHKEAFGPLGIQPDLIAAKVHKLCHVVDSSPQVKPEIKVSGEGINVEVERGGKVLFILGDDERLEGLKPQGKEGSVVKRYDLLDIAASPTILKDCNRRTSIPTKFKAATLLPLFDICRLSSSPMQGRSQLPLNERTKSPVYPSLVQLKKSFASDFSPSRKCSKSSSTVLHRRNMSDPTNGAFLLGMPPYHPLSGVLEETKHTLPKSCALSDHSQSKQHCCDRNVKIQGSCFLKNVHRTEETCETKLKRDGAPLEDWDKIDQHSKLLDTTRVELKPDQRINLQVAESFFGGVLDHYSPIFILHAMTHLGKFEDQLRSDLLSATQHPVLNSQTAEAVAIVAETNKWEIELVSSHSYPTDKAVVANSPSSVNCGGIPVMIAPLVSQISDSLLNLIKIRTPSHFVVQCFEHHLRGVYLKSQLLSEYLIEGTQASLNQSDSYSCVGSRSLYNLSELTHILGIDVNDLPLLLSVASTHTPSLTQMFELTYK